jgi:alkylation response protein AidB-like acyl-CoA dehydrogenase
MDFTLNEDQKMVQETFRRFMERECSSELVRGWEESDLGYSPELWKKMAELGWLGLGLPGKYGGFEGDFLYLVFLYEEMGRVLFPSPHFDTVVMAGQIINDCAREDIKDRMLSKMATGEAIISLATLEDKRAFDLGDAGMTVSFDKGIYSLNGIKQYVEHAHIADYFLTSARIDDEKAGDYTLFLIPAKESDIEITPTKVISGAKFFNVTFKGVKCSEAGIIGEIQRGKDPISKALARWKIVHSAKMLGSAQGAFNITLKYAKEREQFGSRIALFQDISFRLADMATQLDGARLLIYEAGWKIDQGVPVKKEAAMIKALMSELYRHITAEAIQIHGGFGFMLESDPQLFFRRAKVDEVLFGDARVNRDLVAGEVISN